MTEGCVKVVLVLLADAYDFEARYASIVVTFLFLVQFKCVRLRHTWVVVSIIAKALQISAYKLRMFDSWRTCGAIRKLTLDLFLQASRFPIIAVRCLTRAGKLVERIHFPMCVGQLYIQVSYVSQFRGSPNGPNCSYVAIWFEKIMFAIDGNSSAFLFLLFALYKTFVARLIDIFDLTWTRDNFRSRLPCRKVRAGGGFYVEGGRASCRRPLCLFWLVLATGLLMLGGGSWLLAASCSLLANSSWLRAIGCKLSFSQCRCY